MDIPNICEQLGNMLNFIDDHQSFQILKRQLGIRQSGQARGILQIETGHWPQGGLPSSFSVHASQCGLSALPRAQQSDDGMNLEQLVDGENKTWSL